MASDQTPIGHCLEEGCKHQRKEMTAMQSCCLFCKLLHFKLVDIDPKKPENIAFPVCRTLSRNVGDILSKMDQLLTMTLKMEKSHTSLITKFESVSQDLTKCRHKCNTLTHENKLLKTQMADLTAQLNKSVWENFTKN